MDPKESYIPCTVQIPVLRWKKDGERIALVEKSTTHMRHSALSEVADGQKRVQLLGREGTLATFITHLSQNIILPMLHHYTPQEHLLQTKPLVLNVYVANHSCLLLYSRLHEEQEDVSLQPLHSY